MTFNDLRMTANDPAVFYPEKLMKETLITGLNSLFYPDFQKLDFRGIFPFT